MFPLRDNNPTRGWPLMTLALIAVNVAVFFVWQPPAFLVGGSEAAQTEQQAFLFAHAAVPCEIVQGGPLDAAERETGRCREAPGVPVDAAKNVYAAVFVSLFLHGSLIHIVSNMWFLWIFGNNIEEALGRLPYLAFYLVGGVVATLGFVLLQADQAVPLVGASGAIAAVLGGYLALFPTRRIIGLVGIWPVPVPAALFLGLWFFGQFATQDANVAWEAHAVGFAFGFALTLLVRAPVHARLRRLHV
ncbi:MAG: rhomboid family intramembrane serine protease [Dehalococcoidia bacterium]|nr:MAG: rhomboid family intramembrane serine protease [Dehalococcoidia bacterium]